jgi:Mrp family chromosome partitioning ATPase
MGSRVLLLEADLRRPTLAVQLDVSSGPGVSDVLIGVTLRSFHIARMRGRTPRARAL